MRHQSRGVIAAVAVAALCAAASAATAGDYPQHAVEIAVPSSPGAVTDVLGRVLAEGMASQLGQRFDVVNNPRIAGAIDGVAHSHPDGYELVFTPAAAVTVAPLVDRHIEYDPKSFDPICQTFKDEIVILVHPDVPIKTLNDLVRAARAKPYGVGYAHPGFTSVANLAMVEFAELAGIALDAVAVADDADVTQQIFERRVDIGVMPLSSAAGSNLRALGLFAQVRHPLIANLPTMKDNGYDIAPTSFGGLLAPSGLPPDVKRTLADACKAVAEGPAYRRIAKHFFQPDDYFADASAFGRDLEDDLEAKARLLSMLGGVY